MRRIGTLSSEREARTFSDYLFTLKIESQVSGSNGEWEVWLLDEDQLEQGRTEMAAYSEAPNDPKYAAAAGAAKAEREAKLKADLESARQQIDLRERWERPVWMQIPVTVSLLALSILITLLCNFGENHEMMSLFQVRASTIDGDYASFSRAPLYDVMRGEVWRLITPIFIHLGWIHLLGNSMWLMLLGRMIEFERGSWWLLLYVLTIGLISNLAENAYSGPLFGGMSGVVYGLFGYVWLTGRLEPHTGLHLTRESTIIMVVWLFLCTTGRVGNIANMAHFVGLGVGLLLAGIGVFFRRLRG